MQQTVKVESHPETKPTIYLSFPSCAFSTATIRKNAVYVIILHYYYGFFEKKILSPFPAMPPPFIHSFFIRAQRFTCCSTLLLPLPSPTHLRPAPPPAQYTSTLVPTLPMQASPEPAILCITRVDANGAVRAGGGAAWRSTWSLTG